jgi:hypothetical protein
MNLRVRDFPDRGALVWFALTAGIAAWVLHLTVFAALVEFVHDNGYFWFFYLGNAAAIALTLAAGATTRSSARRPGACGSSVPWVWP